jgi:hypothetical protein
MHKHSKHLELVYSIFRTWNVAISMWNAAAMYKGAKDAMSPDAKIQG